MTNFSPSAGAPRQNRRRRKPNTGPGQSAHGHQGQAPRTPSGPAVDMSVSSEPVVDAADFAELGVPASIVSSLARDGVVKPFPIQSATLPDSIAGRDVLGRGKTGSGKTIAFAIPTVMALTSSGKTRQPRAPRSLILVPTRELANQVAETVTPLARALNLTVAVVFGGVSQGPQVTALRNGVDVLVACPGRLEDLIGQKHCRLDKVEVTVLDEADHMADLGFLPGVKRLLDQTPTGTQRLLFSATLDNGIDVLVKRYLSNPVVHSVDSGQAEVSTMTHHVLGVSAADKPTVIRELAGGLDRSLLFTRTKHGAKKLAKQLTMGGIPAVELHGNLSQNARERNLASFADGSTRVLVATDIAARGIHVDEIALVVHVDPPAEHKAYLHRSGRTARAGAEGVVVTIMTPDQVGDVKVLARDAGIKPIITKVEPGHSLVKSLVGPTAPFVQPSAVVDTPRPNPPRRPGTGRPGAGGGRPGSSSGRPGSPGASRQGGAGRSSSGRSGQRSR